MARVLVTFATRKRLTSFVGRPDRLRRQAHPAQPSTPCIPPSRPSRSSTTSNGASREMRRTRRATPASAATASRSSARHSGGGGRAATRSYGTPGSSPASASVSAGRRGARPTRPGRKEYPPRGRRPSWLAERSEPAGSQEPERPSSAARPWAEVRAGRTSPRSSRPPTTSADAKCTCGEMRLPRSGQVG